MTSTLLSSTTSQLLSVTTRGEILPSLDSSHTPVETDLSSLSNLLDTRHSVRAFLPLPVPIPALHTALSIAQLAPSNSNIQNWRLHIVTGSALASLSSKLSHAAQESNPRIPPLPPKYAHFRSELGAKVYGEAYGISRSNVAAKVEKERRNYTFFDAPVAGIVCMDKELAKHDALSVGMWLQSFTLALTAQGLGSCVMVSTAGYEEVVKETLGIGEELEVLCGVAIGYEDPEHAINKVVSGRMDWKECVVEVGELPK
ncbi:Nitroreductase-like protein [Pyrenochaeta sp. MPI-SDFR-AT-0127]|nr:Nitroreductase-like protein [Pyrenochaeta sp. MPI-SDFR-AT-0127]